MPVAKFSYLTYNEMMPFVDQTIIFGQHLADVKVHRPLLVRSCVVLNHTQPHTSASALTRFKQIYLNISFSIVFLYREVPLACDKLSYGQKVSRRGFIIFWRGRICCGEGAGQAGGERQGWVLPEVERILRVSCWYSQCANCACICTARFKLHHQHRAGA